MGATLHPRAVAGFAIALALVGCLRGEAPTRAAVAPAPSSASASRPSTPAADPVVTPDGGAPLPDCDDVGVATPAGDGASGTEPAPFDDGVELPQEAASPDAKLPFADLTDDQMTARLRADIASLGPMSIGRAHSGVLIAAVRMPEGANWEIVSPGLAWGTKETVDALAHAFDAVAARFPGTPKAFVGDISAKRGGHLPPHVSHQSGRDVDLGYYLNEGHHKWYAHANAASLDRARSWHLVRTLVADSDVDLVLIDYQVQRLLRAYALEIGEDPAWLDDVFQVSGKSRRPIIIHAPGHATHLHVRFYSPAAQELGRRAYRFLTSRRLIAPPTLFVTHTVKPGETLSHLAVRYKVTVAAIKKANGLKKDVLRVKKPYKIPQTGGIAMPARVALPPRRVPPAPAVVAAKPRGGEPCRRPAAP
jgi:murein endopeptidase